MKYLIALLFIVACGSKQKEASFRDKVRACNNSIKESKGSKVPDKP